MIFLRFGFKAGASKSGELLKHQIEELDLLGFGDGFFFVFFKPKMIIFLAGDFLALL